jgi:glutathione S-transferase
VTLLIARRLKAFDDRYPKLAAYLARLEARPALRKALS